MPDVFSSPPPWPFLASPGVEVVVAVGSPAIVEDAAKDVATVRAEAAPILPPLIRCTT